MEKCFPDKQAAKTVSTKPKVRPSTASKTTRLYLPEGLHGLPPKLLLEPDSGPQGLYKAIKTPYKDLKMPYEAFEGLSALEGP